MTELKPCPFCGSRNLKLRTDDWTCRNCGATSYWAYNTRPIEDELEARIAQLTAENKRLKAVLNEWDMAWLTDCIAPQPNGNEAFGLDEGLVLSCKMMEPILEETRLLLGKTEVVR